MGFCKILSQGDPGINLGFLSILFLRTAQSIKHPQNLCGSKHSNPHSLLPIIPLVTKCGHLVSPIPGLQLSYWNMRAHLRGGSPQLLLVCGKQPAQSLSRTLVLPLQFYFFLSFFFIFFFSRNCVSNALMLALSPGTSQGMQWGRDTCAGHMWQIHFTFLPSYSFRFLLHYSSTSTSLNEGHH